VDIKGAVLTFLGLIEIAKESEKYTTILGSAVRYGKSFLEVFNKLYPFLESHFLEFKDDILRCFSDMQKCTRAIQVCSINSFIAKCWSNCSLKKRSFALTEKSKRTRPSFVLFHKPGFFIDQQM